MTLARFITLQAHRQDRVGELARTGLLGGRGKPWLYEQMRPYLQRNGASGSMLVALDQGYVEWQLQRTRRVWGIPGSRTAFVRRETEDGELWEVTAVVCGRTFVAHAPTLREAQLRLLVAVLGCIEVQPVAG